MFRFLALPGNAAIRNFGGNFMSSLKGLLFSQFAGEGLNDLVKEMQNKFKPKKGRRFNHGNITYEISRPSLKDNQIEFEISSKVPEDELQSEKEMNAYFEEIKKLLAEGEFKPNTIEIENIVWDSKKETEKERDYVKLGYCYQLDTLYNNDDVTKKYEELAQSGKLDTIPKAPSAFTPQGKLVLSMVREKIHEFGRENVNQLIEANKQVRTILGN